MNKGAKRIFVGVVALIIVIASVVLFNSVTENVRAGWVGYIYDRTKDIDDPNTIKGTSVIDIPRTGLIFLNPFTQEMLKYPTTIVARSWTRISEGDNDGADWSVITSSIEGKDIIADIYISVKPRDIGGIISSFGTKTFSKIVDDDIYGLARGKLSVITQKYSVYDMQAKKAEIQEETKTLLAKDLNEIYGIELIRYEIGALTPPSDIQTKIDQKTEAINAVELAKLDRQKQDEINQKVVDQQKAESEKEMLRRQNEADASAYERERKAKAELEAQRALIETARLKVEQSELEKLAELEKQKAYTIDYFRDKELDVQKEAIAKLNASVKTIITDSDLSGFSELFSLKSILGILE